MSADADPRRAFIEMCRADHRGAISNFFYIAIRDGATDPREICSAVFQHVKRMHSYCIEYQRPCHGVQHADLLQKMVDHREQALQFAAYCFERETMDPAERAREKAEQERLGKIEWMKTQPATEKQIAVLRRLGYAGEIANKGEASELIEKLKDW